jgi:nucleoside-diphosphate-sugar epimerase
MHAELVQGDLGSPKSLERMLAGVDTVIHLGARATFEPYRALRPSIVDGSVNLMGAALKAGVENFVYGGSLLVYGNKTEPITQQTPPDPRIGYSRAKLEAENALMRMAQETGMRFISIRLPHVYGVNSLLFNQIRRGTIVFPGKGSNLFAHLHVEDAARALIEAATEGSAGVWVVADDRNCTWNEVFQVVQHFYPRLKAVRVPRWLALAATRTLDTIHLMRSSWNRYSTGAVKSWTSNLPVVPNTLKELLGIEPVYPTIEQGIPAALDDCVSFYWQHSLIDNH